jgi:hypothetical protein
MVSKIKTLINSLNKTLVLMVVLSIIGIFYVYFLLYFERRIINLPNTYHPDSVYYLSRYSIDTFLSINFSLYENIINFFKNIFHNLLYLSIINIINEITVIVNDAKFEFLKDTIYRNVVKFNIFFYIFGNILIIKFYSNIFKEKIFDKKNLLLLGIILFLPYKTHLTISVLKDSLILFLLIFAFTSKNIYSLILSIFLGTSFRWGFFLYLILFINKKIFSKKLLILLSIIIVIFLSWFIFTKLNTDHNSDTLNSLWISIKEYLKVRNTVEINGRDFDQVPSFFEYKTGSILRGITWPFLFITGTFSIFTKSYIFYCLSIEIIVVQFLMYGYYRKYVFNLNLIIVLMLIAMQTNTFTAFFRYSYLAYYVSLLITFLDSSNYKRNLTN